MGLIKIVKAIGSFFLTVIITAIPSICTLSYVLNWNAIIKFILTIMTVVLIAIGTAWIYTESEDK